jgi:hypothetical protein
MSRYEWIQMSKYIMHILECNVLGEIDVTLLVTLKLL